MTVIIPTFNCASNLERCLAALETQRFDRPWEVRVFDGGSTDSTCQVARRHRATVSCVPGLASDGKNGAYDRAIRESTAEFVWLVDSDNFIVEPTALRDLAQPLLSDDSIDLAVPVSAVDRSLPSFNNWLSMDAARKITGVAAKSGLRTQFGYVVDDFPVGLTNSAMVRREVMILAGGWDSDVRVMSRMRRAGRAKGIVVPWVHFVHFQTTSAIDFARKWIRRIRRFGSMDDSDLLRYFVQPPSIDPDRGDRRRSAYLSVLRPPLDGLDGFLSSGDPTWLWGLAYPALVWGMAVSTGSAGLRVVGRFL